MIKLELNTTEFEWLYYHVSKQHRIIQDDVKYKNDDWDPNYKRMITRLKNKMDKAIE